MTEKASAGIFADSSKRVAEEKRLRDIALKNKADNPEVHLAIKPALSEGFFSPRPWSDELGERPQLFPNQNITV